MANETLQLKTVGGVNVNPITPNLWDDLLEYGGALTVNEKTNKLSVELNPGFPIYYESGSGGLDIHTDSTLTRIYYKNDKGYLTSTDLSVAVPVPDPNPSEGSQADDGSVLTYDSDSDKIVWATPQTFELPADPLPPSIASGGELIALTKEWVNNGTEANPNWGWSDLKWSYVKPA